MTLTIDPDCRDNKHASCVGGPCQCDCHSYVPPLLQHPHRGITDDALMAFVDWCRMNHGRFVYDPALVRRVFDAYAICGDRGEVGVSP